MLTAEKLTQIDARKQDGISVEWHYDDGHHKIIVEDEHKFFVLETDSGTEAKDMFWHPYSYDAVYFNQDLGDVG